MVDSWFSYLQSQICKEFEFLEKGRKKFVKRDWNKENKNEDLKMFRAFPLA